MAESEQKALSWPPVRVNNLGHLLIGECDAVDLAARFGTPLYVFDEAVIRSRCRRFREAAAAAGGVAAYAGKAFLTLAMARIVAEEGLCLEVVSGGELYTALEAEFPPDRLFFHGNNKSAEELRLAVEAGIGRIVVDNFYELELLERVAASVGRRPAVLLRIAPGIEAHTHEYIRTGQEDSKFGFDLASGQALEAARRAVASPYLDWHGLHCHVGSQIFEIEPYRAAAEVLMDLAAGIRAETGAVIREADVGGGFGIRYTSNDEPPPVEEQVAAAAGSLAAAARRYGLPVPRMIIEPGRAIIGEAGVTLYTAGARKEIPGVRTYVAVDGGMADNPRPAMYGAEYTAVVANKAAEPAAEKVRIVGRFCESGDVLIREIALPPIEPGDVIAVFSSGAYQYSMSSNYNRFPRPAAVLVNGREADVIIERESYADLVRNDRLPPRLRARGSRGELRLTPPDVSGLKA